MEIKDIKGELTILTVLDHYGLQADRNNMLKCPFHNDKTPSLQIYPKTNTFCCFSSNCKAGTGDVIDFIRLREQSTKHEAILKAAALCGVPQIKPQPAKEILSRIAILSKFNQSTIKSLAGSEKARLYATKRNLDWQALKIGYAGDNLVKGWSDPLKESARELGLIKKLADGRYEVRFSQCLIFIMLDAANKPAGIYGRKIEGYGHYYLPGPHQGLYPCYPKAETQILILTESIIDCATLVQYYPILNIEHLSILACYGTNGFTKEHTTAIKELKDLKEIIIFFDGDQPGRQGAKALAENLKALVPSCKLSIVNTPDEEDINSLAVAHEPKIFAHLLDKRTLLFSPETPSGETKKDTPPTADKLISDNPHKLIYRTATAFYYIKGGLRKELDSLRVSLDIEHPHTRRKSRSKPDLYEDKQIYKVSQEAAEKLELRSDLIISDLERLANLLEEYRDKELTKREEDSLPVFKVPPAHAQKCIGFLSKPDLINRFNELIGEAGVIGEEMNRLFLFGIATSYKMPDTLHALVQGSSGSGKTHLLYKISQLCPQEDCISLTRVTESSFYNYGEYDLQNKLICLEDLDGMKEEAFFAFRELQSRGMVTSSTSGKDENGNIKAYVKTVRGPIASLSATTKGEIYEDNMSRSFIVAVDETREQTQKIISYQNKRAAGLIDKNREKQITEFIQNCIRLLRPYEVINPYADKVHLPQEAHKIRRLNDLYQSYVRQLTLLNQYRRKQDQQGRLISEKEDLQTASEIMFNSIILKIDELDGSLRLFYEKLKEYIKAKGGETYTTYSFGQREIRQALRFSKSQLQRYINDLLSLEYLQLSGGHINKGFKYKVVYWDDIKALKNKVKRHLQGQLAQLEIPVSKEIIQRPTSDPNTLGHSTY